MLDNTKGLRTLCGAEMPEGMKEHDQFLNLLSLLQPRQKKVMMKISPLLTLFLVKL